MPIPDAPTPYTAQPVSLSGGGPVPQLSQIRGPFVLSASPDRYEVVTLDGEPRLVPVLCQHILSPGLHGISAQPGQPFDPGADSDPFRARLARRGEWILSPDAPVPDELLPDRVPPGGYLRATPARGANPLAPATLHYHLPWERVGAPNARGVSGVVFDRERYDWWRAHLVARGLVPPPSAARLDQLVRSAGESVARIQRTPYPDPGLKADRLAAARLAAEQTQAAVAGAVEAQ